MKNQRGITLIALVVTIVVLLILAGTSIAMLSGETGIISNAQRAKIGNKEGEVISRMNFAYDTVKTQVVVDSSLGTKDAEGNYYDASSETNMKKFETLVLTELGITKSGDNGYTVNTDTSGKKITITYEDSDFSVEKTAENTPKLEKGQYYKIVSELTFTANNVTYTPPTRQVTVAQ